jgi:hypothetical protein
MGSSVWKVNTNHNPLTISQPTEMIIILRKGVALSTIMQMKDLRAVIQSHLFTVSFCTSTLFLTYYEGPCKYSYKCAQYIPHSQHAVLE